jgi:HlyD family secretion protein
MKYIRNKWFVAALVAVLVAGVAAFKFETKDSAQYFTQKAQRGDIHDMVEATGTINAVTTVQVGSQVSGTIQKLFADFNSHVTKGQIVAQIDPSLFQGALLQARADLESSRANLANARANLLKAQATAAQAQADYERNVGLSKEGIISAQALDLAKANAESAAAGVSAAKAQVSQAAADEQQKSATVNIAQTNMDHTIIRSPIDGTVVARSVDVGQTVAASLQAPTLFTIAQDLTKMQVYVSTDESDVGNIRSGQTVTFKVDAFPKETFAGQVSQVRLNATTVQNVVTYTTVVDFNNPDLKLFPGMTAYVSVPVADASNVLRVPNGALRFTPDLKADQLSAAYAKAGIAAPAGKSRRANAAGQPKQDGASQTAVVWKLGADKKLEPVQVTTGITDHTFTEVGKVLHGTLQADDEVVIAAAGATQQQAKSPAAPGGMGRALGGR